MYEQYTLSKTKIALCALVLSGVLVGYDHFVHQASAQNTAPSAATESLSIVNKIEALKLDTTILTDSVFTSLQDFSQNIEPEPVGRPNPFAPVTGAAPRTQSRGR
jgi:hypothetical protein